MSTELPALTSQIIIVKCNNIMYYSLTYSYNDKKCSTQEKSSHSLIQIENHMILNMFL